MGIDLHSGGCRRLKILSCLEPSSSSSSAVALEGRELLGLLVKLSVVSWLSSSIPGSQSKFVVLPFLLLYSETCACSAGVGVLFIYFLFFPPPPQKKPVGLLLILKATDTVREDHV